MKRTALALILILVIVFSAVIVTLFSRLATQTYSTITIRPDGSIEGTSQIQRQGDTYTLTGNLSGGIQVQRSNIVIDGAGYAIKGDGEGRGIDLTNHHGVDPSRAQIKNVTVKDLKIINFGHAIEYVPSVNGTFIGNYVADCSIGFNIWWTSNHTLMHNTIENCVAGITVSFGGRGNVITENNILNSSVGIMDSQDNTVDRNYWSDYLTRYPNATEIGDSGVWDTPYEVHDSLIDNHPLVEPVVVIPEFPDEEPFPIALVVVLVTVVVVAGLLVYFRKVRKTTGKSNNACMHDGGGGEGGAVAPRFQLDVWTCGFAGSPFPLPPPFLDVFMSN